MTEVFWSVSPALQNQASNLALLSLFCFAMYLKIFRTNNQYNNKINVAQMGKFDEGKFSFCGIPAKWTLFNKLILHPPMQACAHISYF